MGTRYVFTLAVFVALLGRASYSDAWGKEGHYMVCKIAEGYLSDAAVAAVADLLPPVAEGSLASVCSWADEVRFRYRWASPLHYVNTPGVCNYNYARDCHNDRDQQGMCVTGAINNYTEQLQSYGDLSTSYNLTESLMFLAHFMGDVHQPLHVSFADDEGGNTIELRWYRRKSNLHHVWDVDIIDTAQKYFYNKDIDTMIEAIGLNITHGWADEVPGWEACRGKPLTCANRYASESIKLACDYAYKDVEPGITLEDDYFFSRYPIVERRIAQGGLRLAAWLNRIFDSKSSGVNPKYLDV